MKTIKEISKKIDKLMEYRRWLIANFAGDNEIDVVDAEIAILHWVLE